MAVVLTRFVAFADCVSTSFFLLPPQKGVVCVWQTDSRGGLNPIRQYRKKGMMLCFFILLRGILFWFVWNRCLFLPVTWLFGCVVLVLVLVVVVFYEELICFCIDLNIFPFLTRRLHFGADLLCIHDSPAGYFRLGWRRSPFGYFIRHGRKDR